VLALIAAVAAVAFVMRPAPPAALAQSASSGASAVAQASQPKVTPPPPAAATATPSPTAQPSGTPGATPTPSPTPSLPETPQGGTTVDMPFVPVLGFWATQSSISLVDLRAAANGNSTRFSRFIVPAADEAAIRGALGVQGTLETGTVAQIQVAVRTGALGILRATDVTPRVHALAIDGFALFGNDRVGAIDQWPLTASVQSDRVWNQAQTWTLVAAGDVMGDRGVANQARTLGKGWDYLFDGGTARVTGTKCCSAFGYPYFTTQRTGNAGLVQDLLSGADIAAANLESAVLVNAPIHRTGLTFTTDAQMLDAVDKAGLDFMSLANNHVRNASSRGILTAIDELDKRGIQHSGAGLGHEASEPGVFNVAGLRVAILSCDAIRPGWVATAEKVGTFNCKNSDVAGRVRELKQNADVVIVFPHWGKEYKAPPVAYQRTLAAAWMAAGADLVIGAHSHIAGAMQDFDGDRLVFYSMGNFVFDQNWQRSVVMGVVPELTFYGGRLVQVSLHATLIIDSQPNLVAPTDGGDFVYDQMKVGSQGLLDY
jgi:poly-gamma-glutamate capsule biosynthesis protein CapA/YwtB (metallophosphatase superfamily)